MKAIEIDRTMSEEELLGAVLEWARYTRWMAYHVRRSDRAIVQGDAGFPDIVLVRPPRLLFVELKAENGRLAPLQVQWQDALKRCPSIEHMVWRPSDWRTGAVEQVLA